MTVKLFIGASCPSCPTAMTMLTKVAKELEIEFEIIDTSLITGLNEAMKVGVRALPAFLIDGRLFINVSESGLRRLLREVK